MRPKDYRSLIRTHGRTHGRARPWPGAAARRVALVAGTLAALGASLSAGATAAYANTGTITANGASVTATISTPNVPATFTFSGTAGEVVTATTSGGNFPNGCDVNLKLLGASGSPVASTNCAGQNGFITQTPLPGAATYTLELSPADGNTGSVTLSLSANPANGKIRANGPAVTFTAGHTGQGRNYSFTGKAGQVITLSASAGTFPNGCDLNMQILSPVGAPIGSASCVAQGGFIAETILPAAGTYAVSVSPTGVSPGANTGGLTLSLSSNPASGSITANGPAVTFTASHTGQGQDFSFTGTAGEVVTLSASGGTFPNGCDLNMQILSPSGAPIGSASCVAQGGFIAETPLPGAGKYIVDVTPTGVSTGVNTGSLALSLSSNPASGSITANGPAVTFTASHTGQGQDFTFAGTAGQVVSVAASGGTFPNGCDLNMQILSPSGSTVASASCIGVSGSITSATLPGTGTYNLDVIPTGGDPGVNVGHVSLALTG